MRVRFAGMVAGVVLVALGAETASACHACRRTPCVYAPAPAPAYQCVTEMVPYTVMKTRTRLDFQSVTETIMVREAVVNYVERQRVVCKPVFDTATVQRLVVECKPVFDTDLVTQCVTVCKPVTTTRQVTDYCMQPTTQLVQVPVRRGHCGHCGKPAPACGCQTVARTTYTPVPVVRDIIQTTFVPETQTRQVPVTRCRMVREEKVVNVPVTTCRMVQEVVTEKIPCVSFRCVPKTVTRQIPIPVCETVPVTCYRPVTRMVACGPVVGPAPQAVATSQSAPAPSEQAAPSGQK